MQSRPLRHGSLLVTIIDANLLTTVTEINDGGTLPELLAVNEAGHIEHLAIWAVMIIGSQYLLRFHAG